jgi:hypothetical protein
VRALFDHRPSRNPRQILVEFRKRLARDRFQIGSRLLKATSPRRIACISLCAKARPLLTNCPQLRRLLGRRGVVSSTCIVLHRTAARMRPDLPKELPGGRRFGFTTCTQAIWRASSRVA